VNPRALRFLLAALAVVALAGAYSRLSTEATMAQTAAAFLDSLTPKQRAYVLFPFEDEERFNWHFIPRERKGLPLLAMNPAQRHLAGALLAAGLTPQGYAKATTIMSLEDVLKELEKDYTGRRDPEKYFFSIFGSPSEKGTWGYRVEGHHLSLNFTIAHGRVNAVPTFWGANPAEVREGPRKGLRALKEEEDVAREFLAQLTPEQRRRAIISKDAPDDILTMNSRRAAIDGQPAGLSSTQLTPAQRSALERLLNVHLGNFPEPIATRRLQQVREAGGRIFFAWAGSENRGERHYYRIQGPKFLVEYDNTQNNANHIHTVWRDFEGDFGLDILGEHYKSSHPKR
jgi:hypothetical protein